MKIAYAPREFNAKHLDIIKKTNRIVADYTAQGFSLTLRQVYYQFVSRGWIENKDTEYKRLGSIINDARLAGLIDWDAIEDRTRYLRKNAAWETPADMVGACADQFHVDLWIDQPYRVEVWVEKDALVGVVESACEPLDVPFFSCRGYTSQTELWGAAQRLIKHRKNKQIPLVLHLGDHDPSGIDMSRDIQDRLYLFMSHHDVDAPEFKRLALNMDQVREYSPPPNPAKLTDSRCTKYIEEYGDESWELDALEPTMLAALITQNIKAVRNDRKFAAREKLRHQGRKLLGLCSDKWPEVAKFVQDGTAGGAH